MTNRLGVALAAIEDVRALAGVRAKILEAITTEPRIATSAINGEPHLERWAVDREEGRLRVAAKAKDEAGAVAHQRKRIAARQSIGDAYYDGLDRRLGRVAAKPVAVNDNRSQPVRMAA